jgi:Trypsin-co-occurring domain 1
MATQIITLADGIRIEAEETRSEVAAFDGKIEQTIDAVKPVLLRVIQPLESAWNDLSQSLHVETAEVEIGFGIESTGHFFVASAKGNVNLKLKLTIVRAKAQT